MTYAETIEFLYRLRLFGTKFGLENTLALAALCGNPQQKLRFIHVAGTNGKGSVCAMLESIYRHSGLRTGLFTSPHLVSFTERIQVDRMPLPENDVARLTAMIIERLGPEPESWPFKPTFFEFVTVMALVYFGEARCDLVIWETGLGGRLDATNIVSPLASVITNIQFDHEQWLGHTLREIAREKAGIIKPAIPVITGVEPGEALDVIAGTARAQSSPLTVVHPPFADERLASLSLAGLHQKANAAVALATVDVLQSKIPASTRAIQNGLAATVWPGRLQMLKKGDATFLLDGAHNPDGARTLASALQTDFSGHEITLILGLFKDKAWPAMCEILIPHAKRTYLVPVASERTADPAEVQNFCRARWPEKEFRPFPSAGAALAEAARNSFVVVAGSLHLVGEAMQELGVAGSLHSERELNEWDAARERAK